MSRWLKETTSHKFFPAWASVRMRARIFSPGWRRIVRRTPGYFSSKRLRSTSPSDVLMAVYHMTSPSLRAASIRGSACASAASAASAKPQARLVRNIDVLDLRIAHELVHGMLAPDPARLESAERRAFQSLVAVPVDPDVTRLD